MQDIPGIVTVYRVGFSIFSIYNKSVNLSDIYDLILALHWVANIANKNDSDDDDIPLSTLRETFKKQDDIVSKLT